MEFDRPMYSFPIRFYLGLVVRLGHYLPLTVYWNQGDLLSLTTPNTTGLSNTGPISTVSE